MQFISPKSIKAFAILVSIVLLYDLSFSQDCVLSVDSGYPIVTSPSCGQANGEIEVQATGSGDVTYQLNDGAMSSTGVFSNLSTGLYDILIEDALGCTIILSVPLEGQVSVEITSLDVSESDCGSPTGSVIVQATGDDLEYSLNNQSFQQSNEFTNLAGGNYTVFVRDGNDCIDEEQFIVIQGTIELMGIETQNTTCYDSNGSIQISANGSGLQYRIVDLTGWQNSPNFNNLPPGVYNIEIRDSEGCILERRRRVRVQLDHDIELVRPDCNQNNGSITILVFTPGEYEFSIDDGATFHDSNYFGNLPPDIYRVVIRLRGTNCVFRRNVVLDIDPEIFVEDVLKTLPICNSDEGVVEVIATGSGLTYTLRNDSFEQTNTTGIFTGLYADNYSVLLANAEGCELVVQADLPEYNDIEIESIDTTPTFCTETNGTVMVNAESGRGFQLSYSFNGGEFTTNPFFDNLYPGSYELIIQSESSCILELSVQVPSFDPIIITSLPTNAPASTCTEDGSIEIYADGVGLEFSLDNENWQIENVFNGLNPGVYIVYVRASNGCTYQTGEITMNSTFEITDYTITDSFCFNPIGRLEVEASGSRLEYRVGDTPFQQEPSFDNLPVGDHILQVRDAYGCILEQEFTIGSTGGLSLDYEIFYPTCEDDNAAIALISTSDSERIEYQLDSQPFQQDSIFTSLAIGTYSFVGRDEFGCTDSITIEIAETSRVEHNVEKENYICFQHPGSITLNHIGGLQPYQYSLDSIVFQSSPVFYDLTEGDYTVYMVDRENCESSVSVEIEYECEAMVPSAFTPDRNGVNDRLNFLHERNLVIKEFIIFNSWGEVVFVKENFMSQSSPEYWEGIDLTAAKADQKVFLYSVTYIDIDDTEKVLKGVTQLLR